MGNQNQSSATPTSKIIVGQLVVRIENLVVKCLKLHSLGFFFLRGKLAQFVPATEIRYVSSYKELQELLNDPKVTVSDIDFGVDSRIAAVTFSLHKDEVLASPFTNCAIASFVTAWGREYLFSVIHYLYPFVLYCDTDSVIYLFNRFRHNPLPQRGRILGDFQTEIPDGLKITAYHALSPKNYHLRFENLETGEITRKWKCKVI